MVVNTRLFGKIDIAEEKVIIFENGIIGMPDYKQFTLIHNSEKEGSQLHWLQSLDDGKVALPVLDPLCVEEGYNPVIQAELIEQLGDYQSEDNIALFVTVRVPHDLTDMSVNLKGPILINTLNNRGIQLIVEGDYPVRFPVYDILQARKAQAQKEK